MGLILGCYWAVASNLTVGITQELTEGAGFAVAHQQMFGIFIFAKLAEWLKKRDQKKHRSERRSIKIGRYRITRISIHFNENMVATSILMLFSLALSCLFWDKII